MIYFHSFWTRPYFDGPDAQSSDEIELWEFEALTWLTSALEIRRQAEIALVTDTRGLQFVRNTGLDWVYNGGISTALDQVPTGIIPRTFWTAGKIYSFTALEGPVCSVDTDAILWRPLSPRNPMVALHEEDNRWNWYASNRERLGRFGFGGPEWNWQLQPVNTGVLYFAQHENARYYAETSLRFMEEFSQEVARNHAPSEIQTLDCSDAMLFADQRLAPMCAAHLGLAVGFLSQLNSGHTHLAKNSWCMHLWASKTAYKYCAEARTAYVNYLIDYLLTHHPDARATLARWKLDQPLPLDPRMQLDYRELPPSDPRRQRILLLNKVKGLVWIEDPNVDVRRPALDGSLVLPAETLRAEPGAVYELTGAGDGKS